jgi:hypothetical protein
MSLSKEDILGSKKKVKVKKVPTPEWANGKIKPADAHVYVRALSGVGVRQLQELTEQHEKGDLTAVDFGAHVCVLLVCDENGNPMLDAQHVDELMETSFAPLERCVEEGLDLNVASKRSRDELRGNSPSPRRAKRG